MARFSARSVIDIKLLLFAALSVLGAAFGYYDQSYDLKDTSREVLFRPGRPLLLECNMTVEPEEMKGDHWQDFRYRWYKNGNQIELKDRFVVPSEQKNSLLITYPRDQDAGTYQCQVKTEYGIASSEPMYVKKTFAVLDSWDTQETELEVKEIQTHFVTIGQRHQLECRGFARSYPKPTLTWMIQLIGAPIVSNTVLERHITPGPDGTLYFAYINQEDADDSIKYVCLGYHPAFDKPAVLAQHILIISANATPPVDNDKLYESEVRYPQFLSQYIKAKEGDATFLYCLFAGAPLLHPDWYFGNTNVNGGPKDRVTRRNRSAGKRLLIKETLLSDQGTYKCRIAENKNETVHNIQLEVVSSPKITSKSNFTLKVEEGGNVTITCIVKGLPKPSVSWVHNAEPLNIDEEVLRYSVPKELEASDTTVDKSLTITKIRKIDKGYYGCQGTNNIGVAYTEFLLVVT